jgi:predicted RNase H-like HicB family nuclease
LTPDESGGYVATIQEFPGLVAEGDSAKEALESLEAAAAAWIESAVETGNTIPEPVELGGYSGKIALRIPRGLHKRSAEMASLEGVSLNQWLTTALAHYLGSHEGFRATVDRMLLRIPVTTMAFNYSPSTIYIDRNLMIGHLESGGLESSRWNRYLTGTTVGSAQVGVTAGTTGLGLPQLGFTGD